MRATSTKEFVEFRRRRIQVLASATQNDKLGEAVRVAQVQGNLYFTETLEILRTRGWIKPQHDLHAVTYMMYALDTHYPWQSDEIIIGGRMKFEEGSVEVPSEPGLGVELDRVALAALHQNYLACGLSKRNDEIEMQKVNPDWTFKAVRW